MPQAKSIIFLSILLSGTLTVNALAQNEIHSRIHAAVNQNEDQKAISALKELQKTDAKSFAVNNYDYLLARLAEKNGDCGTAASNYQTVIERDSVLKEYALWHLSQIMRVTGNSVLERIYLREIALTSDTSLLNSAVNKRIALSHLETANYSDAIEILRGAKSIISGTKSDDGVVEKAKKDSLLGFNKTLPRKDLALLAEAYILNKQPEKAKEIFVKLIDNLPKPSQPDDFALSGARGLDKLEVGEANFGNFAPKLSDEEHFKRAAIYQFNRDFKGARIHYEAITKNHPSSEKVPAALYQIGRGFSQERDYEKAVEFSEKLLRDFPNDRLAAVALYQSAGAYASLDKTVEAVSRYSKYIDENPGAQNIERAFLNIIDAYRDAGNHSAALEWTSKAQEEFKNEMGEAVALFSQARIHISNESWENALSDLNRLNEMKNLGGMRIAGGTSKEEVTFLHGYVLEALGRNSEASAVYSSLKNGLKNYYGWRAKERVGRIKTNREGENTLGVIKTERALPPTGKLTEFGRKDVWQVPQKIKSHKTISDELLFLGLYDEATPELETALRENSSVNTGELTDFPLDAAFTLATFYKRGDMAHRSIAYFEPIWKKAPRDYPIEAISRKHLELLYPVPYKNALKKYGKEKNVDSRFVLSIMRQESRFQPDIKSVAAARGLMQFISNTSIEMAKEMKIENFVQDDLYNPRTAVRFGSHYIAKIFKDFPEQPAAVAASYNAGEDRMMRWFKRSKTNDLDRYIPEVIFSQTKDYVYRVMLNYRIYKMLYDENLNPINSQNENTD